MSDRGPLWLEYGELHADRSLSKERCRWLDKQDFGPVDRQRTDHQSDLVAWYTLGSEVMMAAEAAAASAAEVIRFKAWRQGADYDTAEAAEEREQVRLLRDIFGNPFRFPLIDPAWLRWSDGTVVKMAQSIYDDRTFDRLPILADALEESGCHDTDILSHCREPAEHVRGCWVIDLVLAKW